MRLARLIGAAAALAAAVGPATARATTFNTEGGFQFDVRDGRGSEAGFAIDGSIGTGSADAYAGCYRLRVMSVDYVAPAAGEVMGRTVVLGAETIYGLEVERHITVPNTGGDYVRYVDYITNTTADPIDAGVAYVCGLGRSSSATVWASSDGDTALEPADTWFGTDDDDAEGAPTLAHVVSGGDGALEPTTQNMFMGTITTAFTVSLAPGETVALMVFGLQGPNRATVRDDVDALFAGIEAATDDIALADLATVANWRLAGAPILRWASGQSFEVPEGGRLDLSVTATDREGDATTTAWDLDGDGLFDDATSQTATFVALGIDGPNTANVTVECIDTSAHASRISHSIDIVNAPPTFTTDPPTLAGVGAAWTYEPRVSDPGSDNVSISLVERPNGMEYDAREGTIRWTPTVADIGTASFTIRALDDDGDEALQTGEIEVAEGSPLDEPEIISPTRGEVVREARPTIRVQNPEDINGGLVINFELDSENTFPDPLATGPVEAGAILANGTLFVPVEPDGTTTWTVDEDLASGQYFIRVWGADIYGEGPRSLSHFWVEVPDGGDDDGDDEPGGCACRAAPNAESAPVAVLGLAALVGLLASRSRWRRSRRPR